MQPQNDRNNIVNETHQKLTVVWGALLSSQFVLLAILYFRKKELFHFDLSQPLAGSNPMMAAVLACLSITAFLLSFVLKSRMLKQAENEQNIAIVQTAMIVACALCESISLLGLVLAFAANYKYFFLWFGLGIFGIILHFPKRKHLIAASYKI